MSVLSAIVTLMSILPEIIKLIRALEKKADKREKKKLVKEDVARIAEAFEKGDAKMLNDIFNNKEV